MMEEPISTTRQTEPSRGPWLGLGIGFGIVVVIIAYLIIASRTSPTRYVAEPEVMQSSASDAYAANLPLSDINLSQAENLLGGTATYVGGAITNTGGKTVTGATVEVAFRNDLGEMIQRETQTFYVVLRREPAVDVGALAMAPLKPGESREFRLTFEHVSTQWNKQPPELKIASVTTK